MVKVFFILVLALSCSSRANFNYKPTLAFSLLPVTTTLVATLSSLEHVVETTARFIGLFIDQTPKNHARYLRRIMSFLITVGSSYGIFKGSTYTYRNLKELLAKHPQETKKLLPHLLLESFRYMQSQSQLSDLVI